MRVMVVVGIIIMVEGGFMTVVVVAKRKKMSGWLRIFYFLSFIDFLQFID